MRKFHEKLNVPKSRLKIALAGLAIVASQLNYGQMYEVSGTCTMLTSNTYGPMYSTSSATATGRYATIYPASQLSALAGKALTAAYYKKGSTTNMNGTPNFKIYVKETSDAGISTAPDWTTLITGATLVYDSNPNADTAGAAGWKQFTFSSNFTYSGAANLMVITEYTSNGNTVSNTWSYEYNSPCVDTGNSTSTRYSTNTTGTLGTSLTSSNYRRPQIAFDYFISCMWPSNVTTTSTTANSATISWTPPANAPANGYEVYYSTSNVTPSTTTTPQVTGINTTTTTLTNLNPLSNYYVWVRSVCSGTEVSDWSQSGKFTTTCLPDTFASVTGGTACLGQTATLSANPSTPNSSVNWFTSSTETTPIATGTTYTTPPLSATTDYWVSTSKAYNTSIGLSAPSSTSGNTGLNIGLVLNATKPFTINSVDIYPYTTVQANAGTGVGNITINLTDASGTVLQTISPTIDVTYLATAAAAAPPVTIPLNFNVPVGNGYKLLVTAKNTNVSGFIRESGTTVPTYPMSASDIGSIDTTTSSYYYYFYNLNVSSNCESPREQVTATLDTACLGTLDIKGKENIKIYPNPFTEIVNINKSELVKEVKILDLSGKLIRTINNPSSTLKLSDLQEGMYILTLEMKDGSKQSSKIIKK